MWNVRREAVQKVTSFVLYFYRLLYFMSYVSFEWMNPPLDLGPPSQQRRKLINVKAKSMFAFYEIPTVNLRTILWWNFLIVLESRSKSLQYSTQLVNYSFQRCMGFIHFLIYWIEILLNIVEFLGYFSIFHWKVSGIFKE